MGRGGEGRGGRSHFPVNVHGPAREGRGEVTLVDRYTHVRGRGGMSRPSALSSRFWTTITLRKARQPCSTPSICRLVISSCPLCLLSFLKQIFSSHFYQICWRCSHIRKPLHNTLCLNLFLLLHIMFLCRSD